MKAFTDIEQSKKLAKILPISSADMWWSKNFIYYNPTATIGISAEYSNVYTYKFGEDDIPCWSLAALLGVLDFAKCDIHKDIYGWKCYTWPNDWKYDSNWNDNPIDACYEMILKLHEQKLL